MMKNTGYILALCLTASGHVLAHDVWITGKQAENNVIAEIGYGHNFPSKGTIPDRRDFFETPRLYNGKETITLKPTSTDYVYKIESAGNGNGFAPIFPDTCYHLTHYWPAAADIPVASDNPVHYADAIRYNARTPLQGSLLPLTRLV
ncbi:protein FimG-like protein [Escherichia coli]|nr:protein FimG-like protein [Escherichia coli]